MIRFHTEAEVAAERAKYPGFWICEIALKGATCLAAIPPTPENAQRLVDGLEMFAGADLEAACIKPYCRRCGVSAIEQCGDPDRCPGKTTRAG